MKKISALLLVCLGVFGCASGEKHPSDWQPTPYRVPVDCCMTADQVQGAIRTGLMKRDWTVLDIDDGNVYTHLSCYGTDADVIFSHTDKSYTVNFANIMEEEYNNHDCIYDYVDDVNYVIGRYLKKISKRNAKLEMKAARRAAKQQYLGK